MQNGFYYDGEKLMGDALPLAQLLRDYQTPFYCYSRSRLRENYNKLKSALTNAGMEQIEICYALKANSSLAVINALAEAGAGADIVSAGELAAALAGGVAPAKIIFSGVGKSQAEIEAALAADIARFNVESMEEIEMLSEIAKAANKTAHCAVRINPDIDAGGHSKISTGKAGDKFGIAAELAPAAYEKIAALPNIIADGIDIHIGSQICDTAPFAAAFARVAELLKTLRAAGHKINHLDLGGGLGVAYRNNETPLDITAYAKLVHKYFAASECAISIEPGRALVADAGVLITRVIRTKETKEKNFIIIDASMAELIRPSLYDAYHHIAPLTKTNAGKTFNWDIVGAICESGDILGRDRALPKLPANTPLAIFHCGAYAAVQASNYNMHEHAAEVMLDGSRHQLIRARQTITQILARDKICDW